MLTEQHTWHEMEKGALVGNRADIIRVVSAFRSYRQAIAQLLSSRYTDGEVDSLSLTLFHDRLLEIDEDFVEAPDASD